MAKTILFGLQMNGADVRSLESLKENFDLEKMTEYFLDGRLLRWLEGRHYDEEAQQVRNLNKDDEQFGKKLCEVFGIPYKDAAEVDVAAKERARKKREKLKELTDDEEIILLAARVAFTQEDLSYLLEEGETTIYLCGKKFSIPNSFENRKYVGILSKPEIRTAAKTFDELKAKGITFENVNLPENLLPPPPPEPQEVIQGYAVIQNDGGSSLSLRLSDQTQNLFGRYFSSNNDWKFGYYAAFLLNGKINLDSKVRISRAGKAVYNGTIFAMLEVGDPTRYDPEVDITDCVKDNATFRIHFDKIPVLQVGDIIEAYTLTTKKEKAELKKPQGVAEVDDYNTATVVFGEITKDSRVHVLRNGKVVYRGKISMSSDGDYDYKIKRVKAGETFYFDLSGTKNFEAQSGDIILAYDAE